MQRRIRVTLVTTSFPLTADSISGVFVERLVRALAVAADISVVTPADAEHSGPIDHGNLKVLACRYAPRRWQQLAQVPGGIPVALKRSPLMYLLIPGLLISLSVTALREARTSAVIHGNWAICGCIAGIVGRLLGKSVITTLRGEDVTRSERSILDRLLLRFCFAVSDRVIAVSSDMLHRIGEIVPQQRHKLALIENGVDEKFLSTCDARQYAAQGTELRVVTVGSLIPRKGIDQVIRALARVQESGELKLMVVGSGPEEDNLRSLAAAEGVTDRVSFTGALEADHVPRILMEADIFVLASHSEGRPNALLEAMAAGLPAVATKIPGVTEIVDDGRTGLLFTDGDIDALAQHIRRLAGDPDLRRRLGEAARTEIVDRGLTWSNCAKKYLEVYRQLAAG